MFQNQREQRREALCRTCSKESFLFNTTGKTLSVLATAGGLSYNEMAAQGIA